MTHVPSDDFTPHGYLWTPEHCRSRPTGVVRTEPLLGIAWHWPALAGGYGGRFGYRSALRLCARGGGADLFGPATATAWERVSRTHTANRLVIEARCGQARITVRWHRVDPDTLHGEITAEGLGDLLLVLDHETALRAFTDWGESGITGRLDAGCLLVHGVEDGVAVAATADPKPELGWISSDPEAPLGWLGRPPGDPGWIHLPGRRDDRLRLVIGARLPAGGARVILARGPRVDAAVDRLTPGLGAAPAAWREHEAADERFWRGALRLEGEWPASWRRGVVYDLETVRMMVKPPMGIFRHSWDAMQAQNPRSVLGEAAMDAAVLALADPDTAIAMLLGTFQDALAPQVPCAREDGSVNMVTVDGRSCGTGPNWGMPAAILDLLYAQRPSPALAREAADSVGPWIRWWLERRRRPDGHLAYACSWESGQDGSPRFGDQPWGAGGPTDTVAAVDLEACVLDAIIRVRRWSATGHDDSDRWFDAAAERSAAGRLEALWQGGRYRDHDTRTGWSDLEEAAHLTPFALGLAPVDRLTAAGERAARLAATLPEWPMFAWWIVAAAQRAGRRDVVAGIVTRLLDRAYARTDARDPEPSGNLPGVASEYWPPPERKPGAECYGWGAWTAHLLVAYLCGVEPAASDGRKLRVAPALSEAWPGRRFTVGLRNLTAGGRPADLWFESDGKQLKLQVSPPWRVKAVGEEVWEVHPG
jgi:hypothetical protein